MVRKRLAGPEFHGAVSATHDPPAGAGAWLAGLAGQELAGGDAAEDLCDGVAGARVVRPPAGKVVAERGDVPGEAAEVFEGAPSVGAANGLPRMVGEVGDVEVLHRPGAVRGVGLVRRVVAPGQRQVESALVVPDADEVTDFQLHSLSVPGGGFCSWRVVSSV